MRAETICDAKLKALTGEYQIIRIVADIDDKISLGVTQCLLQYALPMFAKSWPACTKVVQDIAFIDEKTDVLNDVESPSISIEMCTSTHGRQWLL